MAAPDHKSDSAQYKTAIAVLKDAHLSPKIRFATEKAFTCTVAGERGNVIGLSSISDSVLSGVSKIIYTISSSSAHLCSHGSLSS